MAKVKIIGKIVLSETQRNDLLHLGVTDIAIDNPPSRTDVDEICRRIGDAEAVVNNISTPITASVIERCPQLRFIQTWSTGLDHIDLKAAQKAGIIVKNVPDFSVESVAEKTIAMMIFIASQLREANQDALKGNWNYTQFQGVELKGKTLGVIGKGGIGNRVAKLAQTFDMQVLTANSKTSKAGLLEICAQVDFLTLHCPLTEATHYLLGEAEFSMMKKGVYLINYSRGGVVNEDDLLHALNQGIIRYAAIDVFEQEPPNPNNPLLLHPHVFVTPHTAWNTKEAVKKLTDTCIENLKDYFLSRTANTY